MHALFIVVAIVCLLVFGGYLLWQSIQDPEQKDKP